MSYPSVIDDPSFRQDYLILTQSGVTSVAELAKRLNVSRSTIDRLRRQLTTGETAPSRKSPGPAPKQTVCTALRHEHTPRGYREGCRCTETREAWNAYRLNYTRQRRDPNYRPRRRDATKRYAKPVQRVNFVAANRARVHGVRRRVHALARLGHPLHVIAERAHLSARHLAMLCAPDSTDGVLESTAQSIIAACEHLGRFPGFSFRAARHAKRAGHLPPQAWHGVDIDNPAAKPRERFVEYDAAADALAAMVSQWSRLIGQPCTFIAADGSPVSGIVSAIDLRQERGGEVWVEFREDPTPVHVVAFAEHDHRHGLPPAGPPKKGQLP